MLIFPSALLFAAPDYVSVYKSASEAMLGRASSRASVISVPLNDFDRSETLPVNGEDGISTCVMIDASVKDAVEVLLEKRDFILIEGSVISREASGDDYIYTFTWDQYGFSVKFGFEHNLEIIEPVINTAYPDNSYLSGAVLRDFSDNYSLKIYEAEDVLKPYDGKPDFIEAMLSATVIGSTFQPMLGVRDGLGVLNQLGLAVSSSGVLEHPELYEYRKFRQAGDEIYSFIYRIMGMEGDFITNLFNTVTGISLKEPDDGIVMLPEDFYVLRKGDNTDYSMFFYDILKRAGYEVKFIVIDPGEESGALYSTVFFLEEGGEQWGRIDSYSLDRYFAERWKRLPALVFSSTVRYFEPDTDRIFQSGMIELPPPSQWHTALY